MKLANALSQRSELQKRLSVLERRLYNNAQVQEGEAPAEDPQELLAELHRDYAELERLMAAINRTNDRTEVEKGVTLSDLLARRDCLKGKIHVMREFLSRASALVSRQTKGEIPIRSAVNVRMLQKEVDVLSRELRETDERIQEKNWTTELIES